MGSLAIGTMGSLLEQEIEVNKILSRIKSLVNLIDGKCRHLSLDMQTIKGQIDARGQLVHFEIPLKRFTQILSGRK